MYYFYPALWFGISSGLVFLLLFTRLVIWAEAKELHNFAFYKRFAKK
jgi:hypothetical protein